MKSPSLKQNLLDYLRNNEGWHKKVSLYVIADELGFSPETAGRCLRSLAEEGTIFVEYYDGLYSKNLAKYSAQFVPKKKMVATEVNGKMVITYE